MRYIISFLLIATLTACGGGGGGGGGPTPPVSGSFGADMNAFRQSQGQGRVQTQPQLQRAAQAHADDMVRRSYFSHQSPGGPNGDDMSARIASAGYNACAAAENIAQGQSSEAQVFEGWRRSTGHRRNMLGPRYVDYGLGRSGNTWVLVLAAPC